MEANELKTGDLVTVVDFYGKRLTRKAVEIVGGVVYICTEEEYDLASKTASEPICIGFRREFVMPCHGEPSVPFVSSE